MNTAEKDVDELAAIERAAYAGSSTRNPEADVRVLLRLLKAHRALVETLADEWETMADSTSVHGLRDAFRACATDLRGALARVLPSAERATLACALVTHADPEEYARIYNEGYDAAYAQELADDPSAADDWLEAHDATTRQAAADTVLAEARRQCCGENPSAHHAATDKHSELMAFAGRLAGAVRGR